MRAPDAGWLLAALLAAGCGAAAAPEEEIRALVTAAEEAAEARDASALKALVADDYADPAGRGAAEVRNFLHGWLLAHQSVHLLTRVDAIELEGTEQAKLSVTVAMLGREAEAESAWELAGDLYHLELRLARVDGEWRAIRAGPRAN